MEIHIDEPKEFIFTAQIPLRISDINYGGHLSNDAVLSLTHDARMQWLHSKGWSEIDIEGLGIIMKNAAIEFTNQSFYGDRLEVKLALHDLRRFDFDIIYHIERSKDQAIIAKVQTGFFCFSYEAQKIRSIPEGLKKLFPEV